MGRYFLGILTTIALLVIFALVLWVGDLVGVIKLNQLVLSTVSSLPGLNDLAENYELGKKRSEVLKKRETELQALQNELEDFKAKLAETVNNYENEKLNWERQKIKVNKNKTAKDVGVVEENDKYLAMVGGMKPDKAAVVIKELPIETTIQIFSQLRSVQVIKIMEQLPPEYVIKITQSRVKK